MTKKNKKFFIKNSSEIMVTEVSYFDSIKSYNQALSVGVQCYLELQNTLMKDSVDSKDSFIGNMKVVTGLERSLKELEERFPSTMENIHSMYFNIKGSKIHRS